MTKCKKFIIITSIFYPTEAVQKFSRFKDWQLVVVGDKKTPANWYCDNVFFLTPESQQDLGYEITKLLPWNHYSRKMIGYLYAIENGAEIIVDTDDDNIPLENWEILSFKGEYRSMSSGGFFNIYSRFTRKFVWPRGYPLNRIIGKGDFTEKSKECNVGVWQFLANEDPDVDAIYRLTNNEPIYFENNDPVVLDKGTVCPFNSQNTAFRKDLFPLLYLPAFVTFRFTDILRSLVAQPILWQHGYQLGFGKATVIQKRNFHDYLKDFESEIPVYLQSERVFGIALDSIAGASSVEVALKSVYLSLLKHGIVEKRELSLLNLWFADVEQIVGRKGQ